MPTIVSCEISKYILNTKSGVVHPCDCSTVTDLHLPSGSPFLQGFATLPDAQRRAKELGLDGHIPKQCAVAPTKEVVSPPAEVSARKTETSTAVLTEKDAIEILKHSEGQSTRSGHPAHPGLHVPMNDEPPSTMTQKVQQAYASGDRELRAPITTLFRSAADAASSFVALLSKKVNQSIVTKIARFQDRDAIGPSNALSDPTIPRVQATLYSSQTKQEKLVDAVQATLVLECDKQSGCSGVRDLTVVTFYPKGGR